MTHPTREQFEEIFREFSQEDKQRAISREARKLLAIAKDGEQFKSVIGGFQFELLKSLSPMGMQMEPMQMVALLMFVQGCRWTEKIGGGSAEDPRLDDATITKLLEGLDPDKGGK